MPRRTDQVRHEFRGYGHARLIFAILARIAEVWNHRRDPIRRRTFEGIDDDEQFHERVIDRLTTGLHDIDVGPPDIFFDLDPDFPVAERRHGGLTQFLPQIGANFLGQSRVCVSREDLQFSVHRPLGQFLESGSKVLISFVVRLDGGRRWT